MPSYTIVSSSSTYAFFDASDADSSSPSPTSSVKPPSPKFSAFSVIDSISQFAVCPLNRQLRPMEPEIYSKKPIRSCQNQFPIDPHLLEDYLPKKFKMKFQIFKMS